MQSRTTIIGFYISKRDIAASVVSGSALLFWDVRALSSEIAQARRTITAFVSWIIETFPVDSIALIAKSEDSHTRTQQLAQAVTDGAREHGVPVLTVFERDILRSLAFPPLRFMSNVERVTRQVFPQQSDGRKVELARIASGVALHFQTERLLAINENDE